jgi:hypothetical protein
MPGFLLPLVYDGRMADPHDTLAICHHEAGHAIAARSLGIRVTSIMCRPRLPNSTLPDGMVTFGPHSIMDPMVDWKLALIALAGPGGRGPLEGLPIR